MCVCAHVSHDCISCFQVSLRWAASPTFSDSCSPLGSPTHFYFIPLSVFCALVIFLHLNMQPNQRRLADQPSGSVLFFVLISRLPLIVLV